MIPNVVRGNDTRGLIAYLLGPGRANEHRNPRMIVGDSVTVAQYRDRNFEIDEQVVSDLAADLDETWNLQGRPFIPGPGKRKGGERVWHCSLSIGAEEGTLSDDTWSGIATMFMDEMGFDSDDGSRVRWVAIHHGSSKNGNDHIHIAAVMACETGNRVDLWRDIPRAHRACAKIEQSFGLKVVTSRERGRGIPGRQKHEYYNNRSGERSRVARLVRSALACSSTETEFVQALRARGLLIRVRYAKGGRSSIVGYSVSLKTNGQESGTWFKGSGLGKDLSLNAIRATLHDNDDERRRALLHWAGITQSRSHSHESMNDSYESFNEWYQWAARAEHNESSWASVARSASGVCAEMHRISGMSDTVWSRLCDTFAQAASVRGTHRTPSPLYRPVRFAKTVQALNKGHLHTVQRRMIQDLFTLARRSHTRARSSGDISLAEVFASVLALQGRAHQVYRQGASTIPYSQSSTASAPGRRAPGHSQASTPPTTTERNRYGPPRSPDSPNPTDERRA